MFWFKKIFFIVVFFSAIIIVANNFTACKNNFSQKEITENQIELGRYLFFDRRLSVNNTRACATCHNPAFAFTDGYKRSLGAFADLHQRNTQPLFNLNQYKYLTAADSNIKITMQQMENPLFNEHVIEMGAKGHEEEILARINKDEKYKKLFAKAGYQSNWVNIKKAISQFEENIFSYESPYDKYVAGDSNAISASAKNGLKLFFSASLSCNNCHGGKNFSSPNITDALGNKIHYFNIGLYNLNNNSSYPSYDKGLMELTKSKVDMGKFRTPTLRNLAFTAPYFHDGSAASLKEVINHYVEGGRKITEGEFKGEGSKNLFKHPLIKGFYISENEKLDLITFLLSLSDSCFVKNKNHQNPFDSDETKY